MDMESHNQVREDGDDGFENDSLFEGMVLFDPSQYPYQLHSTSDDNHRDADDPSTIVSDQPHLPISNSDMASITSTTLDSSTGTKTTLSSHVSEPLDENLFSDLTLVTSEEKDLAQDQIQIQVEQNPLTVTDKKVSDSGEGRAADRDGGIVSLSRQISRRKRRPGLRIGYGRDAHAPTSHSDLHSPHLNNDVDDDNHLSDNLSQIRPSASPQTLSPRRPSVDSAGSANFVSEDHTTTGQNEQDSCRNQNNNIEAEASSTPEFKLEQLKVQIFEKLSGARKSVESVSASRKDAIRRRRKIMDDLNLSIVRHSDLEKQLEEACEAEDFETAERLSETLASAEGEKQEFLTALKDAESSCDALDSRMHEVVDFLIATEEECDSLLQKFSTDAANNAVSVLSSTDGESAKELEKWHLSNEGLEAKKMGVEIESLIIHECRMVLNGSSELLVEDERKEKEVLCQKKVLLTAELEKLLALVEEKKREIEENDAVIKVVDNRISDAVSGFHNVQSNLDAKYDALQSTLSQMQLESQALLTKRREIDEYLTLEEEKGATLKKIAQLSAEEAETYREDARLRKFLMSTISKIRESKVTLSQTEDDLSKDVQMLQQELHSARASLQELSSRKSTIQQDVVSSKQRISYIDKRVPELEAEKKVAAAGRNFKEAARVAAEAKSLINEKTSICAEIDRALLELEKVEEETKGTMKWLQATEASIQSKEKEVAKARFQRLILVAGTAAAEGAAALELGDTEEANLLLAEGKTARCEAEKLQPVYNFHEDEFANIPKHFISVELVFNHGHEKLADLVASIDYPTCDK